MIIEYAARIVFPRLRYSFLHSVHNSGPSVYGPPGQDPSFRKDCQRSISWHLFCLISASTAAITRRSSTFEAPLLACRLIARLAGTDPCSSESNDYRFFPFSFNLLYDCCLSVHAFYYVELLLSGILDRGTHKPTPFIEEDVPIMKSGMSTYFDITAFGTKRF